MLVLRSRRSRRPDTAALAAGVPPRCRGYAESVIAGAEEVAAARSIGAAYAMDGDGLDLCLADLDEVHLAVDADAAPLPVVRAAALGWAETTQAHYNSLTCADPLTGMSSIHHVQSQIAALYRAAAAGELNVSDISRSHTLVVLDLPRARERRRPGFGDLEDALRHMMAAELIGEFLPHVVEPARIKRDRIVVVNRHFEGIHNSVVALAVAVNRRLTLSPSGGHAHAWTEALPTTPELARLLLDELAR